MIRADWKIIAVNAAANALLLWLAYEWLGVDESNTGKLLLSVVDATAILGLICWLYGSTFVWFQAPKPRLNESFRRALPRVGWLLTFTIVVIALYGLLAQAAGSMIAPSQRIASWLTMTFRKPVRPATIASIFNAAFWAIRWVALPVLLVPLAASVSAQGRFRWRFHKRYLLIPVFALAAIRLPLLIMDWKGKSAPFSAEMFSFALRAAASYALLVVGLLAIARVTAARPFESSPPLQQDRNAAPVPTP